MRTAIIFILIIPFLASCGTTYQEEDFYDTVWEYTDSVNTTAVELHKDGTCDVTNLDWNIIYDKTIYIYHKTDRPKSFHGYWDLDYNTNGTQIINLICIKDDSVSTLSFQVVNLYRLRLTIGDPDDCNYFDLIRTNVRPADEQRRKFLDWCANFI